MTRLQMTHGEQDIIKRQESMIHFNNDTRRWECITWRKLASDKSYKALVSRSNCNNSSFFPLDDTPSFSHSTFNSATFMVSMTETGAISSGTAHHGLYGGNTLGFVFSSSLIHQGSFRRRRFCWLLFLKTSPLFHSCSTLRDDEDDDEEEGEYAPRMSCVGDFGRHTRSAAEKLSVGWSSLAYNETSRILGTDTKIHRFPPINPGNRPITKAVTLPTTKNKNTNMLFVWMKASFVAVVFRGY